MKKVWLLEDTTQPKPLFFAGYKSGTIVLTPRHNQAKYFESEQHANASLTFSMKHQGFVARFHSFPVYNKNARVYHSSVGYSL